MSNSGGTSRFARRLLIIDDSNVCRLAIRKQLVSEDYELIEASSGREGLAMARGQKPELILLDLVLPGMDGFETLRMLKDDPQTRGIPVIFLSGAASTREKARGLDMGAIDFLSKPTDEIELRARVRCAIRTRFLQKLLEERAHLDGLTGLGNRYALEERLENAWQLCRRRGSPLTVVLADLDHFKRINDEYGHATGDEILRRTSYLLRSVVRTCDFVARYGGEEFVVVAPDCDLEGGIVMAQRFQQELSGPSGAARRLLSYPVTTSVGIANSSVSGCPTPGCLLSRADRALYQAKSAGRDASWYWDGLLGQPLDAQEVLSRVQKMTPVSLA